MKFHLPKFFSNKPPVTEDEHQLMVMTVCRQAALSGMTELGLVFHIPNGGGRSKGEGAKLKALGVLPGVSDLMLPVAKNGYHGLWIELKAENGKPSLDQLAWIDAMRRQGYAAIVAWGWQEAVTAIADYMGFEATIETEVANGSV